MELYHDDIYSKTFGQEGLLKTCFERDEKCQEFPMEYKLDFLPGDGDADFEKYYANLAVTGNMTYFDSQYV